MITKSNCTPRSKQGATNQKKENSNMQDLTNDNTNGDFGQLKNEVCQAETQPLAANETTQIIDPEAVKAVEDWLNVFLDPGQLVELRGLKALTDEKTYPVTITGIYDTKHLEELARNAVDLTEAAEGVYITLNPIRPASVRQKLNQGNWGICGTTTSRLNCHELWGYDEKRGVQTLKGFKNPFKVANTI